MGIGVVVGVGIGVSVAVGVAVGVGGELLRDGVLKSVYSFLASWLPGGGPARAEGPARERVAPIRPPPLRAEGPAGKRASGQAGKRVAPLRRARGGLAPGRATLEA